MKFLSSYNKQWAKKIKKKNGEIESIDKLYEPARELSMTLYWCRASFIWPVFLEHSSDGVLVFKHSRNLSFFCYLVLGAMTVSHVALFYFTKLLDDSVSLSLETVLMAELVLLLLISNSSLWTSARRTRECNLLISCLERLGKFNVRCRQHQLRQLKYISLSILVISSALTIWDRWKILRAVKTTNTRELALDYFSHVLFAAFLQIKTNMDMTYYSMSSYLAYTAAELVKVSKKELTKATILRDSLDAMVQVGDQQIILRKAAEHLTRAFDFPVGCLVLLTYLHAIITIFNFIIDLEGFVWATFLLNVGWVTHHVGITVLVVSSSHNYHELDKKIGSIIWERLLKVEHNMIKTKAGTRDKTNVETMWRRLKCIRSSEKPILIFQIYEMTRRILLSITASVATYLMMLLHLYKLSKNITNTQNSGNHSLLDITLNHE